MIDYKVGHYYKRTYHDSGNYVIFIVVKIKTSNWISVRILKSSNSSDMTAITICKDYLDCTTVELDEITVTTKVL